MDVVGVAPGGLSTGPMAMTAGSESAPDGTVTVVINHCEMGQGVTTALAALVAEELEVDLGQVRTEFAHTLRLPQ